MAMVNQVATQLVVRSEVIAKTLATAKIKQAEASADHSKPDAAEGFGGKSNERAWTKSLRSPRTTPARLIPMCPGLWLSAAASQTGR
jgi:hypothetical protein